MQAPFRIPSELQGALRGWRQEFIYSNGPATATWRLTAAAGTHYLKLARPGWEPGLCDERLRLEWAHGRGLPVPRVIDHGVEEGIEWLRTGSLSGSPASSPDLTADPESLVPILAKGLRAFHEAPTRDCPFDFRLPQAIKHVRRRADEGLVDPAVHFHAEHDHLDARLALEELLGMMPATEDVVVCHGDYCPPNVMIERGRVCGYLDLGELGLADRWRDLAVATWSLTWNLGPGWEAPFLEAYGIAPDAARIRFYRLLYDLAS